jgi:hypothetical protein
VEAAKACEGRAAVRMQLGPYMNVAVKILRVTIFVQQAMFVLKAVAVCPAVQKPGTLSAFSEW